mmetsp:Transcript_35195/g.113370  ORF Transcript_35195/g.113370 Transcript_35195/m.113370 type:complete len:87 (+) Transcript_35195:1446-1706(+)
MEDLALGHPAVSLGTARFLMAGCGTHAQPLAGRWEGPKETDWIDGTGPPHAVGGPPGAGADAAGHAEAAVCSRRTSTVLAVASGSR